eukprot:4777225-Pleurochrysis_carterae.AAC.4
MLPQRCLPATLRRAGVRAERRWARRIVTSTTPPASSAQRMPPALSTRTTPHPASWRRLSASQRLHSPGPARPRRPRRTG